MVWRVSMKGEQERKERVIFTEGWHNAEILDVKFCPVLPNDPTKILPGVTYSKSGNPYFWWELLIELEKLEIRTTLLKGKRWLLKQLLFACGIEAKADDPEQKYTFKPEQVLNKIISVNIVNRKNKFTGRDGNEVEFTKSEVNRIRPYELAKAKTETDGSIPNEDIPF